MSGAISNPVMKKIFIILTWAGFTFASHYYAKIFLSGSSHFVIDALILTSVQMLLAAQVLFGNSEVRITFYVNKTKYFLFRQYDCHETAKRLLRDC